MNANFIAIILMSVFNLSHPVLSTIFLKRFYLKRNIDISNSYTTWYIFQLVYFGCYFWKEVSLVDHWVKYFKSISVSSPTLIQAIWFLFFPRESTKKCKPPSYLWFCPWKFACYFHCIFCLNHFSLRSREQATKTIFNKLNQNYILNITHHFGNSTKQLIYTYNTQACLCVKTKLYKSTYI